MIEKPTAVNEEIVNILRLSREHFSRIAMMIAQGDFARLTSAGVDERRRRILQAIFGTRFYEAVQEILAGRARKLEDAWRAGARRRGRLSKAAPAAGAGRGGA